MSPTSMLSGNPIRVHRDNESHYRTIQETFFCLQKPTEPASENNITTRRCAPVINPPK